MLYFEMNTEFNLKAIVLKVNDTICMCLLFSNTKILRAFILTECSNFKPF